MGNYIFAIILIFIAILCGYGFTWFLKETWNDPGMSEEKFNSLFRRNDNY